MAPPLLHAGLMAIRRLPGLLIAGLLAVGAYAETPPEIQCVKQARIDQKTCTDQAKATCVTSFLAAVPPCFGSKAGCASDCLTAKSACEADPQARRDTCVAQCDQRAADATRLCRSRPNPQDCSFGVKFRTLKCKQKCDRLVLPALQRCGTAFNDCLLQCVSGG